MEIKDDTLVIEETTMFKRKNTKRVNDAIDYIKRLIRDNDGMVQLKCD